MKKIKLFASTILAVIFLTTQVIAVGAAPAIEETTPITGTIDSITINTDNTVLVVFSDESGTQTVVLSLEEALDSGLVVSDGDGNLVPNDTVLNSTEEEHPIGSALSEFFFELLEVDYGTIMDYHDEGFGFGVIAQALWMTNALNGGTTTFEEILEAKQTKDFGNFILDDESTPTNWGQFRKAVMSKHVKSKENLGAIMSGRANNSLDETVEPTGEQFEGLEGFNNNGKGPDKAEKNKNKHKEKNKNK